MAYDFLNTTTYTEDLQEQQNMIDYFLDGAEPGDNQHTFENVDPDLIEILGQQEEQESQQEQDQPEQTEQEAPSGDFDYDDTDQADIDILGMLFNEQAPATPTDYTNINTVLSQNVDLGWLKKKSDAVKLGGLNANISKYLNGLPEDIRGSLVATSGNDQDHVEGSAHYDNRAIDLRFNQKAYDFIQNDPVAKSLGISTLPPDHGTAPHIHLQTKKYGGKPKYNFGGKTLYAESEATLRRGLNDNGYDSAMLKLAGTNTIRGLDSYQPVGVTDGSKYQVLVGPDDTSSFKGNVYEKRLQ